MTTFSPALLLAENSLFHAVGEVFHPIFELFANILAFIYGIVPNYGISIILLTILIMAVFTPLTVKSTKSMIAMQAIAPEAKKLQQKYKGPENREQLNRELMALYKEHGVSPVGGCLPMFIQMPFLIVLYDVIRGLTATTPSGQASPDYISHSSTLYKDLVASHGAMNFLGMNLALKPFSHHDSVAAYIPYFAFIVIGVLLQYLQMNQMTKRNPQAAQANKQMQTMQKIMPIFFAYIYFLVPAAVVLYMIVSTIIRIITQVVIFRMGIVQVPGKERAVAGARAPKSGGDDPGGGRLGAIRRGLAGAIPAVSTERSVVDTTAAAGEIAAPATGNGSGTRGNGRKSERPAATNGDGAGSAAKSTQKARAKPATGSTKPAQRGSSSASRTGANGGAAPSGQRRPQRSTGNRVNGGTSSSTARSGANGSAARRSRRAPEPEPEKKQQHPRAKDKRTRKAR